MDDRQVMELMSRIDSMSNDEVSTLLAQMQEGETEKKEAAPAAPPVNMTLPDGTVISAATAEEAQTLVRAHYTSRPAETPKSDNVQPTRPAEFDQKKYYDLIMKDPMQAQNYIEEVKYGTTLDKFLPGLLGAVVNVTNKVKEYEDRQYSSSVGDAQHRQLVDAIVKENGWEANLRNREVAFELAKARGLVKGSSVETPGNEREAAKPFIPPRTGGGSGRNVSADDIYAAADGMSDEQLERILIQNGVLKKTYLS